MGSGGNDGDSNHGVEEYYKKMVQQNPGNSLFLRNYAQFLYQ
ncbi:TPR repeat protein, partial [Trifolium medium]|nr:TPR repeat protein [Trifolium medium]